jgi:hypothetical protein
MKNKKYITLLLILAASSAHAAINVNLGGGTNNATNKDNWTTNNTTATDGGPGLSYNWENVTTNTAVKYTGLSPSVDFTITFGGNINYTVGHGFLFNETFNLASTTNGIQDITMTTSLNAHTNYHNWRLLMVVDGQQYQYNATGNYYDGASERTFTDLHDSSKWVKIENIGVGDINDTLGDAMTQDLLQGTSGIVQFGFISWGSATHVGLNALGAGITINKFEVDITYAVPEPATFALLLGAAGLCFVMIRRSRKPLDS